MSPAVREVARHAAIALGVGLVLAGLLGMVAVVVADLLGWLS